MAVLTAILTPDPAALPGYEGIVRSIVTHLLPRSQQGHVDLRTSAARGLLLSVLGRTDHELDAGWNLVSGCPPIVNESGEERRDSRAVSPQGGFAMIRAHDNGIEAMTDHCGSKTIWHARLACGGVVFSTCMEMIVALLRDFQLDEEALGWFLSAGTSGPRRSWDRRIKPVPPNGRLVASMNGAAVALQEAVFPPPASSAARVDAASLSSELDKAMSTEMLGEKAWLLALSGGHDSRAILHGTRQLDDVVCVTWVDEYLMDAPGSDLAIARQLAAAAGRPHLEKIIRRPRTAAQMDAAMRRFVRYSDGRVDNYLAYVDGMQIWDELGELSAAGLLRGDELFGSAYAINPSQILQNMRLMSFFDYARGPVQQDLARRHNHETPADFMKKPGESAARWRWRLRASYEISTIYAALNSIRSRFVEVTCPLLSQNLVSLAGSMSVRQLSDKALFNDVVGRMYPDIPFASRTSILQRSDINAVPVLNELILDHLVSGAARDYLGREGARAAAGEVSLVSRMAEAPAANDGGAVKRKGAVPVWLKQLKRRFDPPPRLDLVALGMRSYLAQLVSEEMRRTASIGAQASNHALHVGA